MHTKACLVLRREVAVGNAGGSQALDRKPHVGKGGSGLSSGYRGLRPSPGEGVAKLRRGLRESKAKYTAWWNSPRKEG